MSRTTILCGFPCAGGDCVIVKSGVGGHPKLAAANISLSGVVCSAPGHSGIRMGPELAGEHGRTPFHEAWSETSSGL